MIELNNLQLCRGNQQPLSLVLKAGQHWAVLGPNGCGKSTLLHSIARQLSYQGEIILNQKNLKDWSWEKLADQLAVLFQGEEPSFPYTVETYIQFASIRFHRTRLNPVKQSHWIEKLTLQQLAHRPIDSLSGGEWQRVRLATTLNQNTPIILLDEPLNHLDIYHQIQVMNNLKNIQEDHLIISSLHDFNHAWAFCDHIILIGDHSIHAGPKADILKPEKLSRIFNQNIFARKIDDRQIFWAEP